MDERYLTSFESQTSALEYTSGDATLVSPQVSLVGADEVVYTKKIPNDSKVRFAKDETTGRLYFVVDGVYYDIAELVKKSIPVPSEGYGEVDLGLPNGTIWADRNVGAETPQDNGAYFSWGNVEGVVYESTKKSEDYVIEQLIIIMLGGEATPEQIEEVKNDPEMMNELNAMIPALISGEIILISGYSFDWETAPYYSGVDDDNNPLFSKYNGTDGLTVLETIDDAATVNMGDYWRMPTSDEILELVENTDHYYIDESGNIVDKSNLDVSKLRSICFVKKDEAFDYNNRSNFIELPFAGECYDSLLGAVGLDGAVWSSSVNESLVDNAHILSFGINVSIQGDGSGIRYIGRSVRGVRALA